MKKRLLAIFLAVVMLIGLLPTTAFTLDLGTQPAVPVYQAAYTSSATPDGVLDETAWMTNGTMTAGDDSRSFGALWTSGTLYFAVPLKTGDSTVSLSLNNKQIAVTAAGVTGAANAVSRWVDGSVVEFAIPTGDADFTICDYTQLIPFEISVGSCSFRGNLGFSSVVRTEVNLDPAAYVESYYQGQVYETDLSYASSTAVSNGYIMEMEVPQDQKTYYDMHRTVTAAQPIDTAAGVATVEFDLNIASMSPISGGRIGDVWPSNGMVLWVSTNDGKSLALSVYYGKDENLYLSYSKGEWGAEVGTPVALDKGLGETFRLRVDFRADGTGEIFVDGVRKGEIDGALMSVCRIPNNSIRFHNFEYGKPEAANIFTVSNIAIGTSMGGSVLDQLDFGTIRGENTSANGVTSDLALVPSVSNAQLGTQLITWISSNTSVIADDGKVTRNADNNAVAMTAALTDCPAASKSIALVVPRLYTEAYATVYDMIADGILDESFWGTINPLTGTNAGSMTGNYRASWSKQKLYLGLTSKNASKAVVSLGNWEQEYEFQTGTADGVTIGSTSSSVPVVAWDETQPAFDVEGAVKENSSINNLKTGDYDNMSATAITDGVNLKLTPATGIHVNRERLSLPVATSTDLDRSSSSVVVQFDVNVKSMGKYGNSGYGWTKPGYGMQIRITDNNTQLLMLNLTRGNGTNGDADKLYLVYNDASFTAHAIELTGASLTEKFTLRLVWSAENTLGVYVNDILVGTGSNATYTNASGISSDGMNTPNKVEFRLDNYRPRNLENTTAEVEITNFKIGNLTPNMVWDSGTVTFQTTDDKGLATQIDGFNMYMQPASGVNNEKLIVPATNLTLDRTTADLVLDFDVRINAMPAYGNHYYGYVLPSYGLQLLVTDNDGKTVVLAITQGNGTKGNVNELYITNAYGGSYPNNGGTLSLGKAPGDKFNLRIIWGTSGALEFLVDGTSIGTITADKAMLGTNGSSANTNDVKMTNNRIDFRLHNSSGRNTSCDPIDVDIMNVKLGTRSGTSDPVWNAAAPDFADAAVITTKTGTHEPATGIEAVKTNFTGVNLDTSVSTESAFVRMYADGADLSRTNGAKVVSYDVVVNAMPSYGGGYVGTNYPSYGIVGNLTDGAGKQINYALVKTSSGWCFACNPSYNGSNKKLLGELDERFNVTLVWNEDDSLDVQIDGVTKATLTNAARNNTGSACADVYLVDPANYSSNVDIRSYKLGTLEPITWHASSAFSTDAAEEEQNNYKELTASNKHIAQAVTDGVHLKIDPEEASSRDIVKLQATKTNMVIDRSGILAMEFDLNIASMAPYGSTGFGWVQPTKGGLHILVTDSDGKTLMLGITRGDGTNGEADKLYLRYNYGNGTQAGPVGLGVGMDETFTMRLLWSADDSLMVYVNDSLVTTISNATFTADASCAGMAANQIEFRLDNIYGANTALIDLEAVITNVKLGKVSGYDVYRTTELEIPLSLAQIQLKDYNESHRFQLTLKDDAGHTISSCEFPVDMDFVGVKWDAAVPVFDDVEEKNNAAVADYDDISKEIIRDGFSLNFTDRGTNGIDILRTWAEGVELDHSTDAKLISFDVNFAKMPVQTAGRWGGVWPTRGLTMRAADNDGNMIIGGIVNTSQGLVFCIQGNHDSGDLTANWASAPLGKTVGQQFNLGLIWNTDGSLTVQVDGQSVHVFTAAQTNRTSDANCAAGNFEFWLFDPSATEDVEIAITNFRTGTPIPHRSLAEEIALDKLVSGVDMNNIEADFVLPVKFDSPYLGEIPLSWNSGSETITLSDGATDVYAKVYRPSGRISEYVFLELTAFGDKKVYTEEVKVAAMQPVVEENIPWLNAAFTCDTIYIDGKAGDDETWNLNSRVLSDGVLKGSFGAQWDMQYLYLLLNSTEEITIQLNGMEPVALTEYANAVKDTYTEAKILLSDIGVTVQDYGQKIDARITMGDAVWEGEIELTSIDWFVTDSTMGVDQAAKSGWSNNGKIVNSAVSGIEKLTGNIYYFFDHYDAGNEDPAQASSSIQLGSVANKEELYAPLGDMTSDTYLEFDLFIEAMPVWAMSANVGISRDPVTFALNYYITGEKNAEGMAPSISAGIINTEEGLMLLMHDFSKGEDLRGVNSVLLGRSVGDTFRLGTRWNMEEGSVTIFVDGEEKITFEDTAVLRSFDENRVRIDLSRNKDLPDNSNENMDIYITNVAFGKTVGDSLFSDLTFDALKGENTVSSQITGNLVLPETLGVNALGIDGALTWESSNTNVIRNDGTVIRPEKEGVLITLTAKLSNGAAKTFEVYVPVANPTGLNTMGIVNDADTAHGAGIFEDLHRFTLDESNNSIILDQGASKRFNVVVLTDGDETNRLNETSLSIWVSDDNVTYTRIEEDFKILRKGEKTYLYDFQAEGRYVKVHCTHYYGEEADFEGPLQGMLEAAQQTVFGDGDASFNVTADGVVVSNDKDYDRYDDAFAIPFADAGVTIATKDSVRVFLGDELLYHYIDGEQIMVRIPEIAASGSVQLKILSKNDAAMDIANKEYVHEVAYGTREMITLPELCRYFEVLPDGAIFTATSYQDERFAGQDEGSIYYTSRYVGYSLSYDGGLTWTDPVKIPESYNEEDPTQPGWLASMEGVLYDPTIGENGRLIITGFTNPADGVRSLVQRFMYSDDLGETWHRSQEVEFDGNITTRYLGYTSPIRLSTADGAGDAVDYVLPVGAQDQRPDAATDLCCRVIYSKDAGLTWRMSESVLVNTNAVLGIVGGEGGMSEASIMECDDGRLVLYSRNQGKDETYFVRVYSEDKGITWGETQLTDVYTVNTQPMLYNYGSNKLLFWSGNNSLGGESGLRYPLNVGVSDDDWVTFGNIQDLFSRYSLQGMMESYCFKVTNPDMVVFDDVLTIAWNNHGKNNTIVMRVDDFYNFLYRTKGAYDSFENSTFKAEGWTSTSGTVETSGEKFFEGAKSMKIHSNSSAVRSVPYVQNGEVTFELYVENAADANFALELQAAYNTTFGKSAPISLEVVNGAVGFRRNDTITGITLQDGWNTIRISLDLAEQTPVVALSVNDGTAVAIPLQGSDFYVCYANIINNGTVALYMDAFLVRDTLAVTMPQMPHSPVKTEKVDSTCTAEGMEAFWTCRTCGKVFADGLCQNEVTDLDTLIIQKKSHTAKKVNAAAADCSSDGNIAHWKCDVCNKLFSGAECRNEVTLEDVTLDAGHTGQLKEKVDSTCTAEGMEAFWTCRTCGKVFADGLCQNEVTDPNTLIIQKKSHTAKKVNAAAADCSSDGNIAHWKCDVCNKLFSNAECRNEVTLEDVTLDAGHTGQLKWYQTAAKHKKAYECCGEAVAEEEENHQWLNGQCSECGYTCSHVPNGDDGLCDTAIYCTVCTEVTTAARNHTLSVKADKNDTRHTLECTNEGCGFEKDAVHIFDQNNQDQKYLKNDADCKNAKTYYKSCICGRMGTETFTVGEALGHDYEGGSWVAADTLTHWKKCSRCDAEDTAHKVAHDYDSDCDTACNTCGYEKPIPGTVENVTDKSGNALGCMLDLADEHLADKLLTEEEKTLVAAGMDVKVQLVVKDIGATVSAADKALIEKVLDSEKVAMYLDITLLKQLGSSIPGKVTQTNGNVTITFLVPQAYRNTDTNVIRTYKMLRIHNGEVDILDVAYNEKTHEGKCETDQFSTYALVYSDAPADGGRTGDDTAVVLLVSMLTVSALMLAALMVPGIRRRFSRK